MNINVSISDQLNHCELDIPIREDMSANAKHLSVIYSYLVSTDNKEWLDRATRSARGEMISDVDEVVWEAKEVIRSARKKIPLVYRLTFMIKSWLLKLK